MKGKWYLDENGDEDEVVVKIGRFDGI